jgi:hypothetical protein
MDGDVENVCRYLELLRLPSVHPEAPPEFRVLQDDAAGLAEWYADEDRDSSGVVYTLLLNL